MTSEKFAKLRENPRFKALDEEDKISAAKGQIDALLRQQICIPYLELARQNKATSQAAFLRKDIQAVAELATSFGTASIRMLASLAIMLCESQDINKLGPEAEELVIRLTLAKAADEAIKLLRGAREELAEEKKGTLQ